MKKLLKIFMIAFSMTPLTAGVVSCSNNSNWKSFQSMINDKSDNYLVMIDGVDGSDSKQMHNSLWNSISTNPNKPVSPIYQKSNPNATWNNYSDGMHGTLQDSNVKLVALQGQVQSKIWSETWAKNIIQWCGQQAFNKTTDPAYKLRNKKYVNDYTTKFEVTSPIFIYISKGEYRGVHTYSNLNNTKTGDSSAITFYKWGYDIFNNNQYGGEWTTTDS